MEPSEFIRKWDRSTLKESAGAQQHFLDLCALLDEPTPAALDPAGEDYCFEKGATKATGGQGWADVWRRGHFGWEYKGPGKDLDGAYRQLLNYSVALENPPLLIVSDTKRIIVRTNWTNTVQRTWELALEDLRDGAQRQILKDVFSNPEALKPAKTRQQLTDDAARDFAELAMRLRARGHDPQKVAHFVNRLVFCMFAEDVRLLPGNMFSRMLQHALQSPQDFEALSATLFAAMKDGGMVGFEKVEWFNGGLFDDANSLQLEKDDIALALRAAALDWSDIDPSIFGTLFERGLDPDKRSQLGAHYTDRDKIMMILSPVIVEPLTQEWEGVLTKIREQLSRAEEARLRRPKTQQEAKRLHATARRQEEAALRSARALHSNFIERLRNFRVLDPACGSGNFLNLSLLALKDLEHRANLDVEALGLGRFAPAVGPEVVKGIEINPYAAELARVSIWIGEIQWMRRNGFTATRNPILRPLDSIECRDALIVRRVNEHWSEADWPKADVIVGNPPFLGGVKIRAALGNTEYNALRSAFTDRLPATSDLVTYWFEKSRDLIAKGLVERVGLVATNSIRGRGSREVMDRIASSARIFCAWSDEPWTVEGAAVRVSIVCFERSEGEQLRPIRLDGRPVPTIFADLASGSYDLTHAVPLVENAGTAFQGSKKVGPFEVSGDVARQWLVAPLNPNGRANADVCKLSWVALDVVRRPRDVWIVDFGLTMTAEEASLYELPFAHVRENVRPARLKNNRESRRKYWWRHGDGQPAMRNAICGLERFLVTPEVSKHRIFKWAKRAILPDCKLMVIARDDDTSFGVLQSRFHTLWALSRGMTLEDRPTYTPSTTFETFPFPSGLQPSVPAAHYAADSRAKRVADAARRLNELRDNWLNPSDLVERVPELVPGYPERLVAKDANAAHVLRRRTLTNLYNERPAWLEHAHEALDKAVADAYGWPASLSDEEVLARLFELNQQRAQEAQ